MRKRNDSWVAALVASLFGAFCLTACEPMEGPRQDWPEPEEWVPPGAQSIDRGMQAPEAEKEVGGEPGEAEAGGAK